MMEILSPAQVSLARQFLRATVDAKGLIGQALIAFATKPNLIVSSSRSFSSLAEISYGHGTGSFADVLTADVRGRLKNTVRQDLLICDNGYSWSDVPEEERGFYEEAFAPDLVQSLPMSKKEFTQCVENALRRCRSFNPIALVLNAGSEIQKSALLSGIKIEWAAVSCFDQEGAIVWSAQ